VTQPSILTPDFDEPRRDKEGFHAMRARLGRQAGSVKTGLSLFEVPPGQAAYPYHWHAAEEEIVVVLAGAPSVRTPEGWREMKEGDVICFRVGEEGAHQIANRTDSPIRFLAFSNQQPDIVFRPDSETMTVAERRPDGSGFRDHFRLADAVAYHEGEEAP
jgi:uncharacterized cupin superfamily protein